MKILVTGGLGKVGGPVVEELLGGGHEVTVLDRLPGPRDGGGVRYLVGEIQDLGQVIEAAAGSDAIVHLAAVHNPHVAPTNVGLRYQCHRHLQRPSRRVPSGDPAGGLHQQQRSGGLGLQRGRVSARLPAHRRRSPVEAHRPLRPVEAGRRDHRPLLQPEGRGDGGDPPQRRGDGRRPSTRYAVPAAGNPRAGASTATST